ncbi:hypothetical protein INR49_003917 [Caranx melampygus]|nr:hypothetical protein INR49_003917 [Caranx melampygus]
MKFPSAAPLELFSTSVPDPPPPHSFTVFLTHEKVSGSVPGAALQLIEQALDVLCVDSDTNEERKRGVTDPEVAVQTYGHPVGQQLLHCGLGASQQQFGLSVAVLLHQSLQQSLHHLRQCVNHGGEEELILNQPGQALAALVKLNLHCILIPDQTTTDKSTKPAAEFSEETFSTTDHDCRKYKGKAGSKITKFRVIPLRSGLSSNSTSSVSVCPDTILNTPLHSTGDPGPLGITEEATSLLCPPPSSETLRTAPRSDWRV